MKRTLQATAQLAALLGTTWLLIATSPKQLCLAAGPETFTVSGTCGPTGEIIVTNDNNCVVDLQQADAVNLPSQGHLISVDGESTLFDSEWALGATSRTFTTADGEDTFDSCNVRPDADGSFAVECPEIDSGEVACTATLKPGAAR